MNYKGTLTIKLKSDLCAASGYSYAGLVDSDVCFDNIGIPHIPARRIKGCLRQSAEEYLLGNILTQTDIDRIFGVRGDDSVKGLYISDAVIPEYEEIKGELLGVSDNQVVDSEKIRRFFSRVQGQTKLKNGVAEDNSLRYTRVVNRYSPIDKEEMTFTSNLSFFTEEDSEEIAEKIKKIAKATRNIGLKRNRGLGSVECRAEFTEVESSYCGKTDGDDEVLLTFRIRNDSPLMLSREDDSESEKYIPGQALLGCLAGQYLRFTNTSSKEASEDPVFTDLFVNGTTKYLNLVPYEDGKAFYPVPSYINKLKKTKALVNMLLFSDKEDYEGMYDPKDGNQPKKLKGQFAYISDEYSVKTKEIDTQMVYHHSHKGESKNGEEGILYCMEVVEPMQEFIGEIYVKEKYADLLSSLLEKGHLSFGKSKSAQYGKCSLIGNVNRSKALMKTNILTSQKDRIAVTCLSDSVFINKNGEYTVNKNEIYRLVADRLNIPVSDTFLNSDSSLMFISSKLITGYQATWNLRKMPVPAIAAGSSFIYEIDAPLSIDSPFIGVKNHEGYGLVRIDKVSEMNYKVKSYDSDSHKGEQGIRLTREMLKKFLTDSVMDDLKLKAIEDRKISKISASTLGRITLMLKESMNTEDVQHEFQKRIESFKRVGVEKEGEKIYKYITFSGKDFERDYSISKEQTELRDRLGLTDDDVKALLKERWTEFAMTVLTNQKYMKAEKKGV